MLMFFFTGARKDIGDKRDFRIEKYLKIELKELPSVLDISHRLLKVRDQGNEPTCVAFAAAGMKESFEAEKCWLSPRFLFDRIGMQGEGAYPRDALKTLQKTGVCPELCQPYIPNQNTNPCPEALKQAIPNKIKGYARLRKIEDMKRSLFENGPFLISFRIKESWFRYSGGIISFSGTYVGGHAVVACGYNDWTKVLKIRNSWGEDWGELGYGYITYKNVMRYLYDAWSIIDIPEYEEVKI